MSAQRTLASTLRRLGQERQLVDFVLRSQSIANDASAADAVPAALGATDQRRSASPFRGGLFDHGASGSDDLEPIGQSLFGDSAGGGSWWTSSAGKQSLRKLDVTASPSLHWQHLLFAGVDEQSSYWSCNPTDIICCEGAESPSVKEHCT